MATNNRRRGNNSRNTARNSPQRTGSSALRGGNGGTRGVARRSTETKASFKTTEFIAYVLAVIGVLIASYVVKTNAHHADYFRADKAWFYIVLLTLGYMISRGLAKSGSREFYDDNNNGSSGNSGRGGNNSRGGSTSRSDYDDLDYQGHDNHKDSEGNDLSS